MKFCAASAILLALVFCVSAEAAPWGIPYQTWRERFAWDEAVVLVEPVAMEPVEVKPVLPGEVHHGPKESFRVTHVIKGGERIRTGDIVELTRSRWEKRRKDPNAWLARYNEADKRWWTAAQPLSDTAKRYALAVAQMKFSPYTGEGVDPRKHADVFYRFWAGDDPIVRDDAAFELLRMEQHHLVPLRDVVDRELLLRRAASGPPRYRGREIALRLLTITAHPRDERWLQRMIHQHKLRDVVIMPAAIEAYLAVAGQHGLRWVEREILRDPEADLHYAAREALIRHVHSQQFMSRERGLQAIRLLLSHNSAFGNDIVDLKRLGDWEAVDEVAQAGFTAFEHKREHRFIAALRFLLHCPSPEAKPHLARMKQLAPEIYEEYKAMDVPEGRSRWAGDKLP